MTHNPCFHRSHCINYLEYRCDTEKFQENCVFYSVFEKQSRFRVEDEMKELVYNLQVRVNSQQRGGNDRTEVVSAEIGLAETLRPADTNLESVFERERMRGRDES